MTGVSLTFLIFLPFVLVGVVFLWAHLRMALHETAHYLGARVAGLQPVQMVWGSGERGRQFRLFGISVVWHVQPWDGMTYFHAISPDRLRWHAMVYILAGTAVDTLLLLIIGWVNSHAEATFEGPPLWYWITKPLFMWQGFTILLTLIPMDLQIEGQKTCTDGKELIQLLTGGAVREIRAKRQEYLAAMRRYQPDLVFEECWLYRPDPAHVRLLHRSVMALQEGRIKDALNDAERLLALAPMAPGERAQLLDSIANAAGFHVKPRDLVRALAWAREAHVLLPAARPVHSTLGALLVEKGELTEAVSLLEPLTAPENEPEDRIQASCFLAKVCDHLRDRGEAKQWLEKARAIQPTHPLIAHTEVELGLSTADS